MREPLTRDEIVFTDDDKLCDGVKFIYDEDPDESRRILIFTTEKNLEVCHRRVIYVKFTNFYARIEYRN